MADRAPIEDSPTVGALPVNHLGYRICLRYVEEIVIGVQHISLPHAQKNGFPRLLTASVVIPGGSTGNAAPGGGSGFTLMRSSVATRTSDSCPTVYCANG